MWLAAGLDRSLRHIGHCVGSVGIARPPSARRALSGGGGIGSACADSTNMRPGAVPAQMWRGGEPVHGADAAGASPVPVQTWSGCHTSARKEADVPQCAMAQGGAARATDLCRQLAFNGVPAPGSARLGRYDRAPKNSTHADWHTPLRGATDCAPSTNEPASEDERTDGGPHRMRHITAALLHRSGSREPPLPPTMRYRANLVFGSPYGTSVNRSELTA